MSDQTPAEDAPSRDGDLPPDAVRVRLRRAPRYGPFVVTGVIVGVLLGVVVSFVAGEPIPGEQFSTATLARYFAAAFGLLGGLLGAVVALLVERRRG